jgi:hypothetical protein
MQSNEVMAITVGETQHAFRVNGVTVAKRHLASLSEGGKINDKVLAKYLVIVPYLATGFHMPEKASESVKYGVEKAKRLYKVLGINEDNTIPFMMIFIQISENGDKVNSPNDLIRELSQQLRRAGFYGDPSFLEGERQSPAKRTLH